MHGPNKIVKKSAYAQPITAKTASIDMKFPIS